MKQATTAFALILAVQACLWTRTLQRDLDLAPICDEAVAVYRDSTSVPGAFVRVAVIEVWHSPDRFASPEALEKAWRKRAARLGATGLIPQPSPGWSQQHVAVAVLVPADSAQAREVCREKRGA